MFVSFLYVFTISLSYLSQTHFSPFVIYFWPCLLYFFHMKDFNFYVITFYSIAFEFYIMLNSHSKITKNALLFSSGALENTFLGLIFYAFKIYFGIRMEVSTQLNFFQNDSLLFQYRLISRLFLS